jgi:NADP-dependent 3-hydroxy acid dehydrogenase YdfG
MQGNFGRVDVLVLCGGAIFHGTTEQAMLDQFDLQYRSNVRGHYALVQALLPLLRKRRGQVVFINSSTAMRPSTRGVGQFVATQYALRAIADSLREEVNADGIRVLGVYPGRTATPRMAALFEKEGQPYRPELLLQPEDVATMVTHALCLPRTAEVTDIRMRPMMKWC